MSKPLLAFGLNLKKPGASKLAAPRRKPVLGGHDSDSDIDDTGGGGGGACSQPQAISGDLDDGDFGAAAQPQTETGPGPSPPRKKHRSNHSSTASGGPPPPKLAATTKPGSGAAVAAAAMFGDLSSALASRKNAEAAAAVDPNVYEYDSVYDAFKQPQKRRQVAQEEDSVERKPKYMKSLMQAADVRKRDLLIAEEKKIAREREAEGDEFADKERFVTATYRKQQEENRRIDEAEKRREEQEALKNRAGGMSAFYRQLLDRDEQRHAESVKAAEQMARNRAAGKDGNAGGQDKGEEEEAEEAGDSEMAQAAQARAMNEKGASVDVNEDGQVVDKRQLLRGGLNLDMKKKNAHTQQLQQQAQRPADRHRNDGYAAGQGGRRQAMRERQSRMMEEQLAQSMKRAFEDEEAKKRKLERSSKSRKTEGEISSAKDRYLARKRAAEEAKKAGAAP